MDLFMNSSLAMFYFDPQTLRFVDVNDAATTLYG